MKRAIKYIFYIFALLLAFGLVFAFQSKACAAAFYTDIRVLLSVNSPSSIDFTIIGDYYLKEDTAFSFDSKKVNIAITGNRLVLTSGGKAFNASSISLINRDYAGTSSYIRLKNSKYGTCTYLGNMAFDIVNGGIRLINTLSVERYLYGVVPYEMSNTFPMEALKTQAVCARGYAIANCSKNRARDYDILDTSQDQVYHGYASRYNRAILAVDETKGQVLTYDGDIIQAYYSASNGGQTELTGNVWSSNLPYYVQSDDIYDLKNPSSIEQKSFIPFYFNENTIPLMDRTVLDMLQDGANKKAGREVKLISTVRVKAHTAIYNPPSRCYTKADVVLMAEPAGGGIQGQLTVTLNFDDLLYSDKNPVGIFNTKTKLRMRGAEEGLIISDGAEYRGWFLTNRRYGHGVGMSQRGAQQRATEEYAYKEILDFYYADTLLCSVGTYKEAPELKSRKYDISESGVRGIAPGTSPKKLLSGITTAGGGIYVILPDGTKKTDGEVSTGDFIRMVYDKGASFFDLPLIITGDLDGDGKISKRDIDVFSQHIMNIKRLNGAYLKAADVNRDETLDSLDVLRLMKHINGTLFIKQ